MLEESIDKSVLETEFGGDFVYEYDHDAWKQKNFKKEDENDKT